MRIVISGGLGFIGYHVVTGCLARGWEVINLDKVGYASNISHNRVLQQYQNYTFIKLDLTDSEAVSAVIKKTKPNHIIHCAAESHVDNSISAPKQFLESNVIGTFNLIEAIRLNPNTNFKSLIYVSTDEVFGHLGASGMFDLNSKYAPNSPYSASKASSDMLVRAWRQTYNLPFITTNCSNNYGPFQHSEKMIPKTVDAIIKGAQVHIYGDGLNVRNWLYVEDHVDCLLQLLEYRGQHSQFLIGSDVELTNNDLVQCIYRTILRYRPNISLNIEYIADRPAHDFRYSIDYSATSDELNWKPKHSFKAGLKKVIEHHLGFVI